MTKKSDTPAIRFKGFTDTWEQRKLGELCNITTGKLDANAMVSDSQYDFYTSGIDVFKIDVAAFEGPAITIAGNGASVGYMHLADGKFNAYQRTYVLTDFLADRQFLNVAIGNELPNKIQEEVRGSGIPYIVLNMLTDLAIPFPSHEEQYAIGVYFQQLDNLITLHQRKYDKLTNVKKSMLEKMFPKNGSNVPEIRFKGFTEAWEQRKFEEIAVRSSVICSDANLPRVEYEDIVSGAGRLNKDIYAKQSSKSGIAFHRGDVLYGKLRPYLQNWLLPTFDGLAVGDFWVLQPQNADSSFLYRLIQSRQFDEVANQSTGTKMPRADWKLVSKTVFSIPSNISEQAAIGTYFTALDNLITLHQRELEKLKNIKKSCLENMFV